MVLARCANAFRILMLGPARGLELADRAVQINFFNPMAWWAISSARLYAGDAAQSYEDACRGRCLSSKSPHRFWWDLQLFIAAMMTGRTDEAMMRMEQCAARNRRFRPPLRYLAALCASLGEEQRAHGVIEWLRGLEGDFTVERMLQDRDYLASLLHRAQIVDLPKVGAVLR